MNTSTHHASHTHTTTDEQLLCKQLAKRLEATGTAPLFTTDTAGLWDAYLAGFQDPAARQFYNCHACRQFIRRFGGLVTITDQGETVPVLWDAARAPQVYQASVARLQGAVQQAAITGVFVSSHTVWGVHAGKSTWEHMAITPPPHRIYQKHVPTPFQHQAELLQSFHVVLKAVKEYQVKHLQKAVTLLDTASLHNSAAILPQARWLLTVKQTMNQHQGIAAERLLWRAVAQAPAGFCHPRSGMLGFLLDDLQAGLSIEDLTRRFNDKVGPLAYMRPSAHPKEGTLRRAEALFEQLGLAPALARRFVRLDEIKALWRPNEPKQTSSNTLFSQGLFSHLRKQQSPDMTLPPCTMTWEKFNRTVLPNATRIEVLAPARGSYSALVTAVHPDAPPLLQWDRPEARNPVSWYLYVSGSSAESFRLKSSHYYAVEAVTLQPSMWNGSFEHQGKGVLFVMEGAGETRSPGLALFPSFLRSELHGVRSVLEAHSSTGVIEGRAAPHVAGLLYQAGSSWGAVLRVWRGTDCQEITLDRWD